MEIYNVFRNKEMEREREREREYRIGYSLKQIMGKEEEKK